METLTNTLGYMMIAMLMASYTMRDPKQSCIMVSFASAFGIAHYMLTGHMITAVVICTCALIRDLGGAFMPRKYLIPTILAAVMVSTTISLSVYEILADLLPLCGFMCVSYGVYRNDSYWIYRSGCQASSILWLIYGLEHASIPVVTSCALGILINSVHMFKTWQRESGFRFRMPELVPVALRYATAFPMTLIPLVQTI